MPLTTPEAARGGRRTRLPLSAGSILGHAGVRQGFVASLVAAAYYVSGYYGIVAKVPPAGIATVWPPAAVLLAALLLTPPRLWWTYLAVVGPTHVVLFLRCMPEMTAVTLALQLIGYAAQAVFAAVVLRRLDKGPPRFDQLRSTTRFILIGAVGAPVLASTIVVYFYTLTGWVGDYSDVWVQRVVANVIPTLTITPLIVLVVHDGIACMRRTTLQSFAEFGALMLLMTTVTFAVFGWKSAGHQAVPALLYGLLPMLLWAAVRFEPSGLYSCLVLIAFVSLVNAYHGRGPVESLATPENVLALQFFLIAISVPLMLLASLVQERRQSEVALRTGQQRYRLASTAGSSGVWDWNLSSGELFLDPALKRMLGFEDYELENTMDAWTARMHPDDIERVLDITREHLAGKVPAFEVEHRAFHKNGSLRWFLCRGSIVERTNGNPTRMIGTDTDITERKRVEHALRRSNDRIRELAGRLISAQEEERRRIARDLHDDLNQKVAALAIEISSMKQHLPSGAGNLTEKLSWLQARTSELAGDIRALSHEIHPATLEHAGLVPALTSFAQELRRLEGIDVDLAFPANHSGIPPHVAICIYRVAQESIRNVIRHSGTKRVSLGLTVDDRAVSFFVRDEGRGFDVARTRDNGGLGLISIEERVRLLNGRFEVDSRPGHGTSLRVQVPVGAA